MRLVPHHAFAFLLGVMLALPLPHLAAIASENDANAPCIAEHETLPSTENASGPAPSPENDPSAEPIDELPPPAAPHLRFNEMLPDPVGPDAEGEFIEIRNDGTGDADMHGWRIVDAKGRAFTIADVIVPAGAHYSFIYVETKIPLVNSGGTLELRNAADDLADHVAYPSAREGHAYARDTGGGWRWTGTPTPGMENIFDPEPIATGPVQNAEPAETPPAASAPSEPDIAPVPATVNIGADIRIDAFLPDPTGSDDAEWVRLRNAGDADAALDGWTLDDADGGSAPYRLDGSAVAAGGTIDVTRSASKIALNNDGDEVRLFRPDGTIADTAAYDTAPEGAVRERDGDTWRWSTDHPASEAPLAEDAPSIDEPTVDDGQVDATDNAPQDVADIADAEDGTEVVASGIITVPPGVFGKTLFGLASHDGGIAVIARIYGRGAAPLLALGDIVTVAGTVRRTAGGPRISTKAAGIAVTGSAAVPREERAVPDLPDEASGLPVIVQGTVASAAQRSFRITDDEGIAEARVSLAPGLAAEIPAQGSRITVRGVVRRTSTGVELIVLDARGIEIVQSPAPATEGAPASAEPATPREALVLHSRSAPTNAWGTALPAVAALAAVIAAVAYRRHRRLAEDLSGRPY